MEIAALQRRNNVREEGNLSSARTLVLVHGFGTDLTSWDALVAAFAEDCRILRFDNVGAGASDPAAFVQHRYLSLDGYAQDLLEICAAWEVRDACVVGHSCGAMIAALAAVERRTHFSRMVLIGASPRYLNDGAYFGGFTDEDLKKTYSAVMENFPEWVSKFAPQAMNSPEQPELARSFAQTLSRIPPRNALTVLYSILQSDCRDLLPRIDLPTLIVHAHEDLFVPPAVAAYLQAHIRGSRLAQVEARGHFPQMSAPGEVIAAVRGFLP